MNTPDGRKLISEIMIGAADYKINYYDGAVKAFNQNPYSFSLLKHDAGLSGSAGELSRLFTEANGLVRGKKKKSAMERAAELMERAQGE